MHSPSTERTPADHTDPADRLPLRHRLPTTLAKFMAVGIAAYVVTQAGILVFYDLAFPLLPAKDARTDFWLFVHPDVRLLIASAIAVELATVFKFVVHENWTFRTRGRNGMLLTRFVQFNAGSFLSPLIIVGTVNILTPVFGLSPYISTTIGAILGFAVNWLLSTLVIWPSGGRTRAPTETTPL